MTTATQLLHAFLQDPDGMQSRRAGLRLAESVAANFSVKPLTETLRAAEGGLLIMAEKRGPAQDLALVLTLKSSPPAWLDLFSGESAQIEGLQVLTAHCLPGNLPALQAALPNLVPVPLGVAPSFGFGDRIGLATPGHVEAMRAHGLHLTPIFAQQSIREMSRTERSPRQVMADAIWGAFRAGWQGPMGADADHLKNVEEVDYMADAGFTLFTIDPSDHVDQQADNYTDTQVDERFQNLLRDKVPGVRDALGLYAGKSLDLGSKKVEIEAPVLKRAAVKYGRALSHIYTMADRKAGAMSGGGFELEISVDETQQPTTVKEHLFIALELKRHGVSAVSLAPRFIGDFEKGVDYRGDVNRFETDLALHAAIAEHYGPYKISLHSGSDKFGVYPAVGRATKRAFHVKTAGTSYLEALRTACRINPDFFREIVEFSMNRFETDRATYHISATLAGTPAASGLSPVELERQFLDEDNGRQVLHVTYGSVLTAKDSGGRGSYIFRDRLNSLLFEHRNLHHRLLADHLGKHLRLLCGGKG
jgi:hypothetical protein